MSIDVNSMSETERDLRSCLLHIERWLGYDMKPVNAHFANRIAAIAGEVARGMKTEEAVRKHN